MKNGTHEEYYFDYFTNRFLKSRQIYLQPLGELKRKLYHLWGQGVTHVEFLDQRIFSYGDELVEILEELMAEGIGLLFSFSCPVTTLIRNQKLLTPLKKAGLRKITLEVINANPDVLTRYGITPNADDQQYAIQLLKAMRIHLHIRYTMFEPLTTLDHLRDDLEFLRENKLVGLAPYTDILNGYLELEEGTPLHHQYQAEGWLQPTADSYLPYRIIDQRVAEIYRWLLYFDREYGERWHQVHTELIVLRKELAGQRPNWIVTNPGQELMHLTLDSRMIPYQIFQALLEVGERGDLNQVREESFRYQCEQALTSVDRNYQEYRQYHDLIS